MTARLGMNCNVKFGILPEDVKAKILKLDNSTLEIIIEGIFEYKSLDDVKKYIV